MTATSVFIGIIALATITVAIMQILAIMYVGRLAKRVDQLAGDFEREVKPVLANVTEVSQNMARTSALAAAQVQRADELFADVAKRLDETVALVQSTIITPVREGRAAVVAVRAALAAFRELRAARARAKRHDDEDALFIG